MYESHAYRRQRCSDGSDVVLGLFAETTGAAIATGAGSSWTVGLWLFVGDFVEDLLTIADRGLVKAGAAGEGLAVCGNLTDTSGTKNIGTLNADALVDFETGSNFEVVIDDAG